MNVVDTFLHWQPIVAIKTLTGARLCRLHKAKTVFFFCINLYPYTAHQTPKVGTAMRWPVDWMTFLKSGPSEILVE